jgi:hypothetical protein
MEKYGFGWILIDAKYSPGLHLQLARNTRWIKRGTENSVELYQYKTR